MYSVKDNLQAGWVFPFGNPRVKACLSARRGLSQISTSFIAFYRLGIHHMRLFTWPYNPKHFLARSFPFWNEKTSAQKAAFDHKLAWYKRSGFMKAVVEDWVSLQQLYVNAGTWMQHTQYKYENSILRFKLHRNIKNICIVCLLQTSDC